MTARGTLERREIPVLRLRTDAGLEGLGEAVPLSLRGGADMRAVERALLKGTRRLQARRPLGLRRCRAAAGRGRRLHPHSRRAPPAGAGEGGDRDGDLRPRRQGLGAAAVVAARRRDGGPGALQRDLGRRPPRTRSPPTPSAGPRSGFDTFKLKLGTGDDVAAGARGARTARAGAADPGRRERCLGRRRGARRAADDRAPGDRAGRAAGGRRGRRWRR